MHLALISGLNVLQTAIAFEGVFCWIGISAIACLQPCIAQICFLAFVRISSEIVRRVCLYSIIDSAKGDGKGLGKQWVDGDRPGLYEECSINSGNRIGLSPIF